MPDSPCNTIEKALDEPKAWSTLSQSVWQMVWFVGLVSQLRLGFRFPGSDAWHRAGVYLDRDACWRRPDSVTLYRTTNNDVHMVVISNLSWVSP